jgi:sulfite reductase alpha subunit-like flavoprotein
MIQPSNLPENIDKFFKIFPNLKDSPRIHLHANPQMPWFHIPMAIRDTLGPLPWTWEDIAIHLLDIQSVPRLYFFELMSQFATNELEKEKLLEFCSPEGQEDLLNYCNRPKRNILEVFEDFPETTKLIPPQYLFDLIPVIKPRAFSIASSPYFHTLVDILVAVVDYQTKIQAKRKGLCSNWLAHHCPVGTKITAWYAKGSLKFPSPDEVNGSHFYWNSLASSTSSQTKLNIYTLLYIVGCNGNHDRSWHRSISIQVGGSRAQGVLAKSSFLRLSGQR